jgi:hypothetical protein
MEKYDALIRQHSESGGVLRDRKRGWPGYIDIAPSTWWLWVRAGKAPAPVRRGGCTFWRRSDIEQFVRGGE